MPGKLHAHLSGSISRQTLHNIWHQKRSQGLLADDLDLPDPLLALPQGKVDYDLASFFPLFSRYIYRLCSDEPSIATATTSVLNDFEADGIIHLELRTTPRPTALLDPAAYTAVVLATIAAHNARPAGTMRTRLLLSIDRRMRADEAEHVVDLAIANAARGVVGIDVCGDPRAGGVEQLAAFASAVRRARDVGLGVTVHFAEAETSAAPEELALILGWRPERLGHVIHVDEAVRREIVRLGIGLELCLSCNVHAKMIAGGYSDHHFGQWWLSRTVPIALSTDDVGIFCSPLSMEYYLAAKHFNLTQRDLILLSKQAASMTFLPEEEKKRIHDLITDWEKPNTVVK